MRTSTTKKSQRKRSAPKRYVARPSKQGWGVDEGDGMFLDDDERFRGSKPSDFGAGGGTRRGPPGGGASAAAAAAARSPDGPVPAGGPSGIRYDCPSCPKAGMTRQGLASHYGMKHGGKVDWGGVTGYSAAAGRKKPSADGTRRPASNDERVSSSGRSKEGAGATRGRKQSTPAAPGSAERPDLRYDCPICDKANLNRQGLAVHFGMKHGGEIDLSKCVSVKHSAASAGRGKDEPPARDGGKRKRTQGGPGPAPKRARSGGRGRDADPDTIRYDCPSCSKSGMTKHGLCIHYGLKHEGTIEWDRVRSSRVDGSAGGGSGGRKPPPPAARSTRYDCPEPNCGKVGMTRQGLRVHYGIKHVGREVDWARTRSYADRGGAGSAPESTEGRSGGRRPSSRASAGSAGPHGRKSNRSRRPRQPRPTEKIVEYRQDQRDAKPRAVGTARRAGRGKQKTAKGSAGGGENGSTKRQARSQSRRHKHCGMCEACTRDDCGKCRTCLDMPKFGGPGKMRKKCLLRTCNFMVQAAIGDEVPVARRRASKATKAATKASSGADDSSDGDETDDDNLDHVACCLTKCAVDFSDEFFFEPLPDGGDEEAGDDESGSESESDEGSRATESSKTQAAEDESSCGADGKSAAVKPGGKGGPKEESLSDAAASNAVTEESEHGDSGDDAKTSSKTSDADDPRVAAEPAEDRDSKPAAEVEGKIDPPDQREDSDSSEERPPFQLPRRFHDPNNALILCDGPMHAAKSRAKGGGYKCNRAYLQKSHFVPVLSIPRGQWRCLICRYRDEQYMKGKGSSAEKDGDGSAEEVATEGMTDEELNAIFRCNPELSTENEDDEPAGSNNRYSAEEILALEQRFELVSAPLKARLLREELTTKSRKVIKSALSAMRLAEHSLRSFTETSRARKALTERIESLGMPQEMYQTIHKIASNKMKILNLISTLERIIRGRRGQSTARARVLMTEWSR